MSVDKLSLLDTNVIIYLLDGSNSKKSRRAEKLVQSGLRERSYCISQQVIQETLNVATQKLNFAPEDAERLLDKTLLPLLRIAPAARLYERGLRIQSRYLYSFYDSLIIAAALEAGCKNLYSEDLQDGQRIEQLTIVNPFRG